MQNDAPRAFVALGTNAPFGALAGAALLEAALAAMQERGVRVLAVSRAWASEALPRGDQPDFVNAVALVDPAGRTPGELYAVLAEIEAGFGRVRRERWAQRTLDLDIIDFDGRVGQADGISLPHPRAHERKFVLAPLAELAPDWRHPVTGKSIGELVRTVAEQRAEGRETLRVHVAHSAQDD